MRRQGAVDTKVGSVRYVRLYCHACLAAYDACGHKSSLLLDAMTACDSVARAYSSGPLLPAFYWSPGNV